jgi:hypothetical protein
MSSNNKKNPSDSNSKLTPAELGITEDLYAYCYCEENIRRAVRAVLGAINHPDFKSKHPDIIKIEPFAVFCSSYVQPEPLLIFPGSWLRTSLIDLVVDSQTKKMISWDYHVFLELRVTRKVVVQQQQETENNDDSAKKQENSVVVEHLVADYNSGLCTRGGPDGKIQKLVSLSEFCSLTFSKIVTKTARVRVVEGMEYWDKFRSTRAHMLPQAFLKNWLQDKTRRNMPVPNDFLQQKPLGAAVCGDDNEGVDLAHFINMATQGEASTIPPGKVLTIEEFRQAKW